MREKQCDKDSLFLIDAHLRSIEASLEIVKFEIRSSGLDAFSIARKREVLRSLFDELNVLHQLKKQTIRDIATTVAETALDKAKFTKLPTPKHIGK